jgi:hypothetical protein
MSTAGPNHHASGLDAVSQGALKKTITPTLTAHTLYLSLSPRSDGPTSSTRPSIKRH